MDARIEAEEGVSRAERTGDVDRQIVLCRAGVRPRQKRLGLFLACPRHEVAEGRPEPLEHPAHLLGAHPRLEVVEQGVVRLVGLGKQAM